MIIIENITVSLYQKINKTSCGTIALYGPLYIYIYIYIADHREWTGNEY
jgi:hypothetical protein